VADNRVVIDVVHGVDIPDPYRWLEDGSSAETREWVARQNQITREALDARPDRSRWFERLSALVGLPAVLSVRVAGDRLFVLERPEGADQYALVVRSATDSETPAITLVDPAGMAADAAVAIDWYHPSPDGSMVAYGLSEGGTENSTLHVMRVPAETGGSPEVLAERIRNTRAASVAWRPDHAGFWYAVYPEGDEYHRHIRWHALGSAADGSDDPVVFDRLPTPQAWPDVSVSSDGRWLLVHLMVGWSQVDVHLLDTTSGEWRAVVEGVEAQSVVHVIGSGDDARLVGVTTREAPNGRVMSASVSAPHEWRTMVAERPDVVLGAFAATDDSMVLVTSRVAVDSLEIRPLDGVDGVVTCDLGAAGVVALDADGPHVVAAVGTFGSPVGLVRIDTATGSTSPWGASYDASVVAPLTVTQVFYPSLDGTMIPMFVAHRADVVPSPQTPLILTGYGGFAIAETPVFMPNLAAWCAAGGVYAIAGLRGGYEYGEAWHHAGRRGSKQNVFDDFHCAADWLVAEGYTSRERLALHGGSNGGLLMGVAITQRPDLAPAVWCAVPLLDMIRFPRFLIARLWTDEYGDPDIPEECAWLLSYSPYHHVEPGTRYPAVLFTTAEGDTRVDPCHARKMAALMQDPGTAQDDRPVLLWQAGRAGHGVGKPAAMRVAEGADVLSFFTWQLGLEGMA
jgi:prolyl oligopeptidase